MASTKYTYSIQNDFPNHKIDSDRLTQEIRASAIITALDYIHTVTDDCNIWFKDALSGGDETILDGLVAAHTGEPLTPPTQQVEVVNTKTADNRITVRQTIVNLAAAFRPRAICFYTADPSKLHNNDPTGTPYEDSTCKCYAANGDEITQAPYTAAVKTVIDFEPPHYYEMIGGGIDIPTEITGGTTNEWYGACIGLPDIPAPNGCIDLKNEVNLEALRDGRLRLDGRGVLGLNYDAVYHTNKIRFIFKHPAGVSYRFQLYFEIFR